MKKILFAGAALLSLLTNLHAQTTVAHWKFTPEHTSGSIRNGDLVITDLSAHNNNLYFKPVSKNSDGAAVLLETLDDQQKDQLEQQFTWVDDVLGDKNQKSLLFNTGARNWDNIGAYFETAENAELNTTYFEGGYTIEVLFKLPHNFTSDQHRWTSIFSREGSAKQYIEANPGFRYGLVSGEKELLHGLTISSLQEMQWFYWMSKPKFPNWANVRQQTSWSFSLADLEDWYHVTLINDGTGSKVYVNGVTDFRNAANGSIDPSAGMLPSLDGYGWLVGATGYYQADNNGDGIGEFPITKLFDGTIQEMRFTKGALPKEEWLYANEESEAKTNLGTNNDIPLLTDENNYNIVFVPDTQKPTRYMSEIVDTQMQWIADNDEENNIVFTNFLGDLVDRYNQQYEWNNILKSLDILKTNDVRFMTVDGNHDGYNGASITDNKLSYDKFFNPEYYKDADYYGNQSPSGYAAYSIIRGGNYSYVFITVSHYITNYLADLEWVNNILDEYSYLPVIFSTHEHLGFEVDGSGTYRVDDKRAEEAGVAPEDLYNTYKFAWQRVLKGHNNVFMAMSGHNHGAGYQLSNNDFGNEVFEGVYDYQSDYHGGNGWMNFLEFDEDDNKISFKVFSPWVDQITEEDRTYYDVRYRTGAKEYFDYNINFSERFNFYPQLSIESKTEGSIVIDSKNLEDITDTFVAVYPEGAEMIYANETARTTKNPVTGKFNLELNKEGHFVAVVRKTGVYIPISNQISIDLSKPSVQINSDETEAKINTPIPVTVTFSEKIQELKANDIVIDGGTLSHLTTHDNINFTFMLTPNKTGTITANIPSNVVSDLAKNTNTAASEFSIFVEGVLGIHDNLNEDKQINVYPNPVKDIVNLEVPADADITVYNLSGAILDLNVTKENKTLYKVDFSLLSPAVYFIKVNVKEHVETIKIIKKI